MVRESPKGTDGASTAGWSENLRTQGRPGPGDALQLKKRDGHPGGRPSRYRIIKLRGPATGLGGTRFWADLLLHP